MASHNIEVPDKFVEAMQDAELPLDTLMVDWVALEGAVCWNIKQAADEIGALAECAENVNVERIGALTGRIESLAAVRERMEAS